MAQHHVASCNFGVAVDEVDSKPLVDVVLDKISARFCKCVVDISDRSSSLSMSALYLDFI